METRRKRSLQRKPVPPESPVKEEVEELEPNESFLMSPEDDNKISIKKKKSRSVQVDMDDISWRLNKKLGHWELDREEEPLFLPENTAIDSQCRCCLRKLDKTHLILIERSLKTKMRLYLKIRVHPYDSYPFVCVNCTNLIHALADFRGTLVKSKILLKHEQTCLDEDNWVAPEHLAAAATCRKMVDEHRKRIEEIYDVYQQRLRDAEELEQKRLREPAIANETAEKAEISTSMEQSKEETNEVITEGSADESKDSSRKLKSLSIETYPDSSDDESANIFNAEDIDDVEYQPPTIEKPKKEISSNITSNELNEKSETTILHDILKRKRGRPRKEGSSYVPKSSYVKKPKKIKAPKDKNEPHDKSARQALCPICGKSIHITVREAHMNQHNGVRPFKCPYNGCSLSFYGKNYWSQHIKRMHGNNGGVLTHECDICGKTIRGSLAHLKQHQARHAVTDKDVVCNVCGQTFWLVKYLKKHMIIHTDLFPYECQYCGKKFKHKASKDTHEKNVHEKHNNFGSVPPAASSGYPEDGHFAN